MPTGCAAGRCAGWTWPTCAAIPRLRSSGGSGRCTCGSESRPTAGSPPKRRTVFTVPEMDWVVDVLEHYVAEVRPRFGAGGHPALWVTERCGRLSKRSANDAFDNARQAAELPEELDLHSLRHSMITHLVEFDYPERFVQDQAGHRVAATTAIYTGVSDEYRNRCCGAG